MIRGQPSRQESGGQARRRDVCGTKERRMAVEPGTANLGERKAQILEQAERDQVKFMRLQFTDILGTIKNVEIPNRQFEDALDGRIMFDGSAIEGLLRIE